MQTKINPGESLQKTLELLQNLEGELKPALKLLKELSAPQGLADTRKLKQKLEQLKRLSWSHPSLEQSVAELAAQLEEWRVLEERQRPMQFGRLLKDAADECGVPFAPLTSDPPCYRLDPLTVEISISKGVATLAYARIPLGECSLDAKDILEQRERYLAALEGDNFDPKKHLEQLHLAYRRCLLAEQKNPGDRVDLVDLLPELALLQQSERFRLDPTRENFKPYGKVRLGYDLARLRRAGQLEHQGTRLTLGTATMGTTKHKERVLYLEEAGRGQFYLSLAFVGGRP